MYRQVHQPTHHRADILGFVPEHILVMEEKLGRPINKGEIVHHQDFNKLNNDPDNLLLQESRKVHQQFPKFQALFILSKGLYPEFLEYWLANKDLKDPVHELQVQLTQLEYQRKKLATKLKKQKQEAKLNEKSNY